MNLLRLLSLVALIASVAACSDPFAPPPPATGGSNGTGATGGTGGTAATGGTGTGGTSGVGGSGGTGGVGGPSAAHCENAGDQMAITELFPENLRTIAANCAVSDTCTGFDSMQVEFTQCVSSCVQTAVETATSSTLSSECADCYGDLGWCSGPVCNDACTSNACMDPSCLTCEGYADCLNQLKQCAGRFSLDCPGET